MKTFHVDSKAELTSIIGAEMGDIAYVVNEASKYMINSQNEWVNQTGVADHGLASEEYVDEAIIELVAEKPALKMFDEDPAIMASNPGSKFGIALNKDDTRTLPEAMLAKGVGMYNFWVHKSNQSLPAAILAKNSSCRGLCCVDTIKSTGWYGWIVLFDHDGDIYVQYIRNSEPKGWKQVAFA